jgi:hypothetical protein
MEENNWDPVVQEEDKSEGLTNAQFTEQLISKVMIETAKAHNEKYDAEKAEKTAAMCLDARMHLSKFIEDVELRARQSKSDIERVEAERYFVYRDSKTEKKATEQSLKQFVAQDEFVIEANKQCAKAEAELKKWSYLMDCLKDSFYYFKSIATKNKLDY